MAKSSTFYPSPDVFSSIVSIRLYGVIEFGDDWRELRAELAERFECEESELGVEDFAWAGGERFADFVTREGRIIGALNEKLTPAEWAEFHATRIDDGELLIRDVIAAARARPQAA